MSKHVWCLVLIVGFTLSYSCDLYAQDNDVCDGLMITVNSTNITCSGASDGTANATVIGSTEPFSISWSTGSTDASITNLAVGEYFAIVSTRSNCVDTANFVITEPSPIELSLTTSDITCTDATGTITANVTGGSPSYSYEWLGLDETGPSVIVGTGTWTVTVTDANGCVASGSVNLELQSQTCEGGFVTVTQGGWGSTCHGNNWGCYRDNNFAAVFPNGLTIGACDRFITLTSASAVNNFLPCGGKPGALNPGTIIDPSGSSIKNTLAGQVATLTLTIGFDNANADFASSSTLLKDLTMISGTFANWTVSAILEEANKSLGGCSDYSASELSSAVDVINNNYDDGTVDLGALTCSCGGSTEIDRIASSDVPEESFDIVSNLISENSAVEFSVPEDTNVSIDMYSINGTPVKQLYNGHAEKNTKYTVSFSVATLVPGLYITKMKTSRGIHIRKLMVSK